MTTKRQAKCPGCGTKLGTDGGFLNTNKPRSAARYCDTICMEDAETRRELYRRGTKHGE